MVNILIYLSKNSAKSTQPYVPATSPSPPRHAVRIMAAALILAISSGRFVVYSSTVNEGRTSDGIAAGGSRLATEVTDIIESHRAHSKQVTLSFVGNSLGGLYSRYALSEIDLSTAEPFVFCTTATPHLGVSQHTYVPLPRWGEWVVAHSMWPTGRDLFQYTPVIHDMALDPKFKAPLQRLIPSTNRLCQCPCNRLSSAHMHSSISFTSKSSSSCYGGG
jgi:hypothetical protein